MRIVLQAWRTLRRSPRTFLPAILSIALGVGAAAAAATLLHPAFGPVPTVDVPTADAAGLPDDVRPAASFQAEGLGRLLRILLLLGVGVLGVAAMNAAVVGAVRDARRRSDRAVRAAVGATRARLLAERLAESSLIWGVGATGGAVGGLLLGLLLRRTWPGALDGSGITYLPPADGPWWAAAVLACLLFAWLSLLGRGGIASASIRDTLASRAGLGGGRAAGSATGALVATQIALVSALLVGGGLLLGESLGDPRAGTLPAGYHDTLTLHFDLTRAGEGGDEDPLAALLREVRRLPGVRAASVASPGTWFGLGPVAPVLTQCGVCFDSGLPRPMTNPPVRHHRVAEGFFEAAGLRMIAGRAWESGARPRPEGSLRPAPPAVVNATYARRHFQNGDPLGRSIVVGGFPGVEHTVVGVVEDLPAAGIGGGLMPGEAVFLSHSASPPRIAASPRSLVVALHATGDPEPLRRPSVDLAHRAGLGDALVGVATLAKEHASLGAPLRWLGGALAVLGLLGLALSLLGVLRTTALAVDTKKKALAIRLAMGAPRRTVVLLVLRRTLATSLWGLGVGFLLALEVAAQLRLLVPEVPLWSRDVYLGVALALVAAVVAGALGPALDAARVDPAVTLREG